MAPFTIDPVSTFMAPVRRKTKIHKTSRSSGTLSKPAAIAIVVVVAVVLIAAIVLSIIMQRRRKAKSKANKHGSTMPGYSNDNSGGMYGGTPGYFVGQGDGSQQQLNGAAAQEKHPMDGGAGHEGGYGDYGRTGAGGYPVDRDSQGEAASYYNDGQYAQGGGAQGRDYGRGNYDMPQRPPMSYNYSPGQA